MTKSKAIVSKANSVPHTEIPRTGISQAAVCKRAMDEFKRRMGVRSRSR